jgi:CubicO group peptidase (beta-lactamase class C family)
MKDVDEILMRLIAKNKTPSVRYAIFTRDNIIYEFNNGFADIKEHTRVCEDTTYHLFSVTKTFTALAVLQLAEKKQLSLEDPVSEYLEDFPYSNIITIRQLLSHSAGIPNPNPLSWIHLETEHASFKKDDFFKHILEKYPKVKFEPNEKFKYSNLGYVFLGQLIEGLTGQSYEEYIRNNILNPLSIKPEELGFQMKSAHHKAKGYQKRYSLMNVLLGLFMDKSKFMSTSEGIWKPFQNYLINGTSYGGLIGNADGLRIYIQELLKPNCVLISDEFKRELFTENVTNLNKTTGMALSWFKGTLNEHEYYAHAGGGGGYYCEIRVYLNQNIGSVITFNRTGIKDERFLDKLDKYQFKA